MLLKSTPYSYDPSSETVTPARLAPSPLASVRIATGSAISCRLSICPDTSMGSSRMTTVCTSPVSSTVKVTVSAWS